ncbi:MAG TPA: hypothetical protein VH143_02775 [Kofleriaceae bacterium]|jgi:hypothetical protein|nr:hypothetical protein [Kofleriaceae bacterium]
MRAIALTIVLAPALALADWPKTVDPDCRCERAFPAKPTDSTRPSPWPNVLWHRSEAKISATEWYAVSWAAFDKTPPPNAFDASITQLVGKGTLVTRSAIRGQANATVKRADGTTIAIRVATQGRRVYVLEAGDVAKGTRADALFDGFHAWTDKDATPEGGTVGVVGDVAPGGTLGDGVAPKQGTVVLGAIKLAAGKLDLDAVNAILEKAVPRTVDCFDNVTKPATFTITLEISRVGNTTPTIAGLDGDPKACMHEVFTNAPIGKPRDDNPAKLVIHASYTPPAKH